MTSQIYTKVHLVRCPKCQKVLPELADVPIFGCGGCGAILKAKNRKRDNPDTGSYILESNPTQRKRLAHFSEGNREIMLSTWESDLYKILEGGKNDTDCTREWLRSVDESHEFPCLDTISCHENSGSSPGDKFPPDHYGRDDQNESRGDDGDNPGETSVSNEISSSPKLDPRENESLSSSPRKVAESQYLSENNSGGGQTEESLNSTQEWPIITTSFSKTVASPDKFTPTNMVEDVLPLVAGADQEVDKSLKSQSIFRGLSPETFLDSRPKYQISATARSSSSEIVSSDFNPGAQLIPWKNVPRVCSKTDPGVKLGSPTAGNYYPDDGGVSSCNENDDHAPIWLKRNFKDTTASENTKGQLLNRDEFLVRSNDSKLQHRPMNSSSNLPAKKHLATKKSKRNQDAHSHPIGSMMTMETDEYLAGPTSYSSSEKNNLPDSPKSVMELLRMVYELQFQINITQISCYGLLQILLCLAIS